MSVLEIDGAHRAYRQGVDVLAGVSMVVRPGQVVGLLGRNGAGKTTLIHLAMGMIEPQRGSVRLFGLDPRRHPVEVKRRVGYVSEEQVLPRGFRVGEVIELHRQLYTTWDEALCSELLDGFGLDLAARVGVLSKGQARQVALLCAVSHRPELLILDEPAAGLDPAARREILETAIRLLADGGTSVLFSSHYMPDVERVAERVVMLMNGRVLIDTDLERLREEHCMALIAPEAGAERDRILALPGCLGVRPRGAVLHAIFDLAQERCRELLASELGIRDPRFVKVGLEEMFIELAGGQA